MDQCLIESNPVILDLLVQFISAHNFEQSWVLNITIIPICFQIKFHLRTSNMTITPAQSAAIFEKSLDSLPLPQRKAQRGHSV